MDNIDGLAKTFALGSVYRDGIIVADNFYANPDAVRSYALEQHYSFYEVTSRRPSPRPIRTEGMKRRFEELLGKRITDWDLMFENGIIQHNLSGDPMFVHSDGGVTHSGILYLSPDGPVASGTCFYRRRETRSMIDSGPLPAKYTVPPAHWQPGHPEFDALWEEVDRIGMVYNRVILWDAMRYHSAASYFGHSLSDARLYQVFFFNCEGGPQNATLVT
jgi:hypothetical protein